MPKKAKDIPKRLYNNTHRILPLVVNKELPLDKIKKFLEGRGLFFKGKVLFKFLTSYFFRKRLVEYLDALDNDTDPEYYIELYLFP